MATKRPVVPSWAVPQAPSPAESSAGPSEPSSAARSARPPAPRAAQSTRRRRTRPWSSPTKCSAHNLRDELEGAGSMDQVKRTYRTVKTDLKKTARGIDGTDVKDQVGNAGGRGRREAREPGGRRPPGGPAAQGPTGQSDRDARTPDVVRRRVRAVCLHARTGQPRQLRRSCLLYTSDAAD